MILWIMVWSGYNTEIGRVFAPDFPSGFADLFHGLRSFLPFLAAFLAIIMILKRGSSPRQPLKGPIGLLALYVVFGVISSVLFSVQPWTAFYWAAEYGTAVIVLWAIVSDRDALQSLSRLLTVNWVVVTIATIGLLLALGFLADIALVPTEGSPLGVEAYGGSFTLSGQMLGMTPTRNTGFGRFAGLATLVILARLWQGKGRPKYLWLLLPPALFALVFTQARTATISLIAGTAMLFLIKRESKLAMWAGAVAALVLLGLTGFYSAFWMYITRTGTFNPTLSGRTVTWQEAWMLFEGSPWLGLGFWADRIYLPSYLELGTQAHNVLLQALIQAGVLGTVPLLAAFAMAWVFCLRLYLKGRPKELALPYEIPCLLAFVSVMSIPESTFALYSVPWLVLAPCIAYLQVVAAPAKEVALSAKLRGPIGSSFQELSLIGPRNIRRRRANIRVRDSGR